MKEGPQDAGQKGSHGVKNAPLCLQLNKISPRGLSSIAAIIAMVTIIALVTMATLITIVATNLSDRHGHVAHLAWSVTMAMMRVAAWCVMLPPLRLAVIMAMSIVMRIIERRNQQRADGYASDYGNDLVSLESGSTACRHKTSGQYYYLGNSTKHKYLLVSKGTYSPTSIKQRLRVS
jgi:hypothetical protein